MRNSTLSEKLKLLHSTLLEKHDSLESLLSCYLNRGCQLFGLEHGVVSHITFGEYIITAATGSDPQFRPGARLPLINTYCYQVYERQQTIAVHQVGSTEPFKNLSIDNKIKKIESFISTPIWIGHEVLGTLCFHSSQKREAFDATEITLIELMAVSLGHILELKEKDCTIEQQRSRNIHTLKLAALGEMAGELAHEISSPLTSIVGNADHLLKLTEEPQIDNNTLQEYLKRITTTTFRISEIIQGMRAFVGLTPENSRRLVPITEVIDLVKSISAERFRSREINLDFTFNCDVHLLCNPTQIAQVLINLLNNAFDAVCEQEIRWVRVSIDRHDEWVEIKVTDSGKGISKELQPKIMAAFFTTKPLGQGTGLGLSISQELIRQHDGELIYDANQSNTTFCIRLPLVDFM